MVLISEPSKVSTFIHNGVKLNVHAVLTCTSIDGVLYVENVMLGEYIFHVLAFFRAVGHYRIRSTCLIYDACKHAFNF